MSTQPAKVRKKVHWKALQLDLEPSPIVKLADEERPTAEIDKLLKTVAWKTLLPEGTFNRRTSPKRFARLIAMMTSRVKMELEYRLKNDHLMRSQISGVKTAEGQDISPYTTTWTSDIFGQTKKGRLAMNKLKEENKSAWSLCKFLQKRSNHLMLQQT